MIHTDYHHLKNVTLMTNRSKHDRSARSSSVMST